jgi:predicted MFS family arabinose efflux permease
LAVGADVATDVANELSGLRERLVAAEAGRYALLAAAIGAFFATMIARVVISPVVPAIIASLSVTRGAIGLALTGMWAAYALAQFASGVLGAQYGEKRVIVAAVGLTGVGSLALAAAGSYVAFAAAAVFLGGSAGLYFSAGSTLLTRRFENTGQALGFHSTGGPLAGLVGPVVAVWVAGRFGWRSALLVGAVVAFPVCLLFLWRVDPMPPMAGDRALHEQVEPRRLLGLLARPSIAYTVAMAILLYFVWQSFYSFFPTFLAEHWGFSTELAGILFGGVFAGTALSLPALGRLSDAVGRDTVLGGTFLALAAGLGVLVVGVRPPVAVLGCGLVAVGMGFPGVLNSRFMDHLAVGERGHGFGLIRSVNLLLGSTGSVVTGVLADAAGWTAAFGLLAALMLVPLGLVVGNRLLEAGL